jgi:hypothetical protein
MEMSENLPSSGFCVFLEINRLFGFLAHEGYEGDYFLIGIEVLLVIVGQTLLNPYII